MTFQLILEEQRQLQHWTHLIVASSAELCASDGVDESSDKLLGRASCLVVLADWAGALRT